MRDRHRRCLRLAAETYTVLPSQSAPGESIARAADVSTFGPRRVYLAVPRAASTGVDHVPITAVPSLRLHPEQVRSSRPNRRRPYQPELYDRGVCNPAVGRNPAPWRPQKQSHPKQKRLTDFFNSIWLLTHRYRQG